ncbi:MAG: amidohydrolase [Planctomycetaceae bacterium]|nr:amidohydrolase [Planctomycetaceae bacterium]
MNTTSAVFLLTFFAADPADLIVHHAKVVTVDPQFRIVEAIAVRGERVVAVGEDEDILKLAGPKTKVIDLEGRTVLPGLMDSHTHPTGAAMYEYDHPVPEMETIADVLKYIEQRAKATDEGDWIVIQQVFVTRLRDQRFPNRQELDQVAPKNPVLFRTGPDGAVNSLALKLSGIDKDFKITDGQPGYLERDPKTGELTGILRSCTRLVKTKSGKSKPATEVDRLDRLKQMLAAYNAVGLTSIADRDCGDDAVRMFEKLHKENALTCRVFCSYSVNAQDPLDKIEQRIKKAAEHPLHAKNDWAWLRGVKSYLDGGMLTGSAYMREPWGVSTIYGITDAEYRGLLYIPPEKLRMLARLAFDNGFQFTAHTVGDGAVHSLIDAYETINREMPLRDHRPCITHCNFMSREAIDRMKAVGIVADLQPAWLRLDGATLLKQFGQRRTEYFQPYKSLADSGVIVGGGSDHMQKFGSLRSINPYNPFLGMWIALTRQPRWAEQPLHPEQRITREQALRLYTINNAFVMFAEKDKGSLEPGKLADFIVLDRDYLTCPVNEVADIEVRQTFVGGRQVYEAGATK